MPGEASDPLSLLERSRHRLNEKFSLKGQRTFFRIKRTEPRAMFIDAILKIRAKVVDKPGSDTGGFYIFSVSTGNKDGVETRRVCLQINSLEEVKFIQKLNCEFGSGDIRFGGLVKKKDKTDYFQWLKEEYQQSGETRTMTLAPFMGYHKDKGQWVLSNKLQFDDSHLIDERDTHFYVVHKLLKKYELVMQPNQIQSFNFFSDIFSRVVNLSDAFKENKLSFLLGLSFMIKSYLNNYMVERSDTGETRYCMLYSEEKSTGKTTSMKMLAAGQGVPSDESKYFLGCGDNRNSGSTPKPLKKIFEKTNLFIFINDYKPSKVLDELLLQSHEGFNQCSGTAGDQYARCALLLTGNMVESNRLSGRVMRIQYIKKKYDCEYKLKRGELEMLVQSNKGFLVSWCYHYSSLWFEDETRRLINSIDNLIGDKCADIQARLSKAWASTVTAFLLVMYSVNSDVNMNTIITHVLNNVQREMSDKWFCMAALEKNIVAEIEKDQSSVSEWLKVDCSFTSDEDEVIKAVGISSSKILEFPDINTKMLREGLVSSKCKNAINVTMEFGASSEEAVSSKGYKIPETKFSSKAVLKTLFEAFDKTYDRDQSFNESLSISDNDLAEINTLASRIKRLVRRHVREKQGLPRQTNSNIEDEVYNTLPQDKRDYLLKLPSHSRKIFIKGYCTAIEIHSAETDDDESGSSDD